MKFPIAIPRGTFKTLLIVLASLCGGLIGAMFTLALRGVPIPEEFGKCLLGAGSALGALIVGPKPRDETDDASIERPVSD